MQRRLQAADERLELHARGLEQAGVLRQRLDARAVGVRRLARLRLQVADAAAHRDVGRRLAALVLGDGADLDQQVQVGLVVLDRQLHLAEAAPEHRRVLGQRQDQVGQIAGPPLDVLKDDRVVDDQRHRVVDAETRERPLDLIDQRRRLERDANLARVEIDLAAQAALQLVPEPRLAVHRLRRSPS